MIPRVLWQTYKTKLPPKKSVSAIASWFDVNPSLKWGYMDDEQCEHFIKEHFDNEFYKMYSSLPFGVMKSDVWRVAVVYVYGGIYSDLDTTCLKPVEEWLIPDVNLITYIERPNGSICNYTFASTPQHPALRTVLDTFVQLYNSPSFLSKESKTPIQDFGAHGWSLGILKHYNLLDQMTKGGEHYNTVEQVKKEKTYFYPFESKAFCSFPNSDTYVYHECASLSWTNDDYDSWRIEQKKQFDIDIVR